MSILLVLLVVAALAVGGWFLLRKKNPAAAQKVEDTVKSDVTAVEAKAKDVTAKVEDQIKKL